ncbi:MAG: hypothetical protein ABL998_01685 [Planctomycetota bacterium]
MFAQPESRAGENSFHDLLYDWLEHTPWLALSAAAHLLAYFLLTAIPWSEFREPDVVVLHASVLEPTPEVIDEPEPPLPEEPEPVEQSEPELVSESEDVVSAPVEDFVGTSDELFPAQEAGFEQTGNESLRMLGLGVGSDGKLGPRVGGRGQIPRGSGVEPALEDALAWLAAHQGEDGSFDGDGFSRRCGRIGATTCGGPGSAVHDVGLTALALLAFLGDGHTSEQGAYREVVARGLAWLRDQQDPDSGLIGERTSRDFLYDHALATLALCEAFYFTRSPRLKRPAQNAVNVILQARNPYGAWRYDLPPVGDSDTSVTGWMVFALASAKEAGLHGDFDAAFAGALGFLDEVSDPASGRVGYSAFGELSARTAANEHFPRESNEAMTAVGLLCRIFLGQKPETNPLLAKHAELVRSKPPVWDPAGYTTDMYAWYYGTYALYQMGKPWWPSWEKALRAAVVDSQRKDGDERGSWDPVCAWGTSGGRVYATALMTLTLEVYFRYGRVLGAR